MAVDKMSTVLQPIDTHKLTTSFMKCILTSISGIDKTSAFPIIQGEFDRSKGDVDSKRIFLDQSFRDCVTSDSKLDMDKYSDLVQLSIKGVRVKICSDNLPIILLSDMFDIISLQDCEKLFYCVEENIDVWKEPAFFQAVKNHILRICNDLLRRLSRTQNTVFCGRILLFLAKFFPFSERSGLNIISEFNLDNTTVFSSSLSGKEDGEIGSTKERMDIDNDSDKIIKIDEDEKDLNIDYALYSKFWQLQDFFRNPIQCYEKSKWLLFSKHAKDVFAIFKSFKLDSISGKKRNEKESSTQIESSHQKSRNNHNTTENNQNRQEPSTQDYFAKYLTNQNLLQLQLSDSNFRRYILVQFLILFQYLKSAVKFKNEMQILSDDQSKWVSDYTEQAYSLINETPPNGQEFAKAVKHILKREEQWNAWKNDGCPSLNKDFSKSTEVNQANGVKEGEGAKGSKSNLLRKRRRNVGEEIKEALENKRYLMGNATLTKLWNVCPDNFEAAAAPERDFLPNMDDYFAEATEQIDPANQVEDQYKKINNGQWGWKALRLLAKRSPYFFTYGNSPISKLNIYLETMLKNIYPRQLKAQSGTKIKSENEDDNATNSETTADNDSGASAICTEEQLLKLSVCIKEYWRKMIPKLGLTAENIKSFEEAKSDDADRAYLMLTTWSKQEGEAATKEEMIYVLDGLVASKAINKASYEEVFN